MKLFQGKIVSNAQPHNPFVRFWLSLTRNKAQLCDARANLSINVGAVCTAPGAVYIS